MQNSRYRDVIIYAVMEHMQYHRITDDGVIDCEIAEYDDDPQIKYWNIFGMDGMIETNLYYADYPELSDVKKYIDKRIEEE